jgi:Tol biopolymer transport system component
MIDAKVIDMGECMNLRPSLRRTGSAATVVAAGLAAAVQVSGPAAAAPSVHTERVSVSTAGAQVDDSTISGDVSDDGRYVVYSSYATTLVPGDTNAQEDVFLRDRQTGTTTRLSVAADGSPADGSSGSPQISGDGRYITFISFATNLVAGPQRTEIGYDVYLLDRLNGTLDRISESPDGRPGNGDNYNPTISADGRYVAFQSYATNLVPGVPGGNVLIYDRTTGQLSPVSVAADGTTKESGGFSPSISENGRYVAFVAFTDALVPGDTNGVGDVYVRDRTAGTTTRASVADDGSQIPGDSRGGEVSNNGRVIFWSDDTTVVPGDENGASDTFVRDLAAGTTTLVTTSSDGTQGDGYSVGTDITPNGRYVLFYSSATNLIEGDSNAADDVFRKDLQTGTTTLVSRRSNGAQGNNASVNGNITPNGKIVVYGSDATNLAPGDTNGLTDVYITRLLS